MLMLDKIQSKEKKMSVKVKFVNYRTEGIDFHPIPGNPFRIVLGPAKCWDRDPKLGTLSTGVLHQHEAIPPPRPQPKWIEKTNITWEDCPENCDFALFRSISFYDNNVVKLKKRPGWVPPVMSGLVVEFLLKSYRLKSLSITDTGFGTTTILSSIPARRRVAENSKYAKFKKWIFIEEVETRKLDPKLEAMEFYEIGVGHGEDRRSGDELAKIEQITATDRNERLSQVV